ncbi:MarR family transcriptional regulator [Streptomyces sp. NPDC005423]|uniref:MarR family transcriptional regulator n=1 Tax=Streptomyces sp. NPDC005423 TaxID=3155343 RepID=UPI0033A62AD8
MTTSAPQADGRVIGLAHYAGRAVLESVLTRHGLVFEQQITLRLVAVAGGPVERERLAGEVAAALRADETGVREVLDGLVTARLIAVDSSGVRITDAGRELYERVAAETGVISARIYADIPAEDLVTAGRVLTLVTERADAELAAVAE